MARPTRTSYVVIIGAAVVAVVAVCVAVIPRGGHDPSGPVAAPVTTPSVAARPPGMAFMIVGDSITQGSSGDFTWRYRLFRYLSSENLRPHFVGPYDTLFDNVAQRQDGDHSYADPNFEQAHDALWGRTLDVEQRTIRAEVAAAQPDYLLVLLGVDDLAFGVADIAQAGTSLQTFVANARAANPRIRIVLGELLPDERTRTDPSFAATVQTYNQTIVSTAQLETTATSPIVVADDGRDIDPDTDLYDGSHPNAEGEVKIAAGFADALAANFGIGAPYPRPYPVEPTGPQTPPQLTVTASRDHLTLAWTASPGATGYAVYWRQAGSGADFARLPYPLPMSSSPWTGAFPPGCTCQVKLQAYKDPLGHFANGGKFSNTVTATVGS
jgi:hypothetical protein